MMLKQLPRLAHREELPLLFNLLAYDGMGVEIGVAWGGFSTIIRRKWQGGVGRAGRLCLVDRWHHVEGWQDNANVPQEVHDEYLRRVREQFRDDPHVRIMQAESVAAAACFEDESLDWLYLDADHSYEAVQRDLEAWYPRVRRGGLLSGHDFMEGNYFNAVFGVRSAVEAMAAEHGLTIVTTAEPSCPSWYCLKA